MTLKLPFFPTPYKDELLYSVISRYHLWSRNPFPTNTNMDLFDSNTIKAKIGFPNGLGVLVEKIPSNSDDLIDRLIRNNSMYPLYHPFLEQKQREKIIAEMKKTEGKAISLAGVIQSNIPIPRYLRYCVSCLREDEHKYGEPYWLRTHQIFGVNICPLHNEWLIESNVEASDLKKSNVYTALDKNVESLKLLDKGDYEKHLNFSKMVYELLNNDLSILGNEELKDKYLYLLKQKDLATFTGVIKEQSLIEQFVEFYGGDYLKEVHSEVNVNTRNNWVNTITRPKSKVHPLRHLLLINFLGLSLEEFFSIAVEDEAPFGKGPWVCFNAASDHYLKPVIKEVEIKRGTHTKLPVGTFKCSCGFVYAKTYSKSTADMQKMGMVKSYGSIWNKKLVHLRKVEKKTIREVANELHVTPLTVIRKLRKLDENVEEEKLHNGVNQELKKKHQNVWTDLIKKYPEKSITELRNSAKASYIWLYRNNKSWLESNSPEYSRKSNVKNQIDWKKRDNEFSKKIPSTVSRIKNKKGRPVRITCCSIGKELRIYPILQYGLDKLQNTKRLIEKFAESVEEFQIRRVKWATEELQRNGDNITASKIMKKASLAPSKIQQNVLLEVIKISTEVS
ncbi:TnsD family transposase [Bacillus sp. DJP31]|uniref:TnsD family transposase n=1 Tax=Bacillus sp. DJP31 TaxID=3409789 RepID=UPI003BB6DE3A